MAKVEAGRERAVVMAVVGRVAVVTVGEARAAGEMAGGGMAAVVKARAAAVTVAVEMATAARVVVVRAVRAVRAARAARVAVSDMSTRLSLSLQLQKM